MMWPMSSPAVARRSLARLGPIAQLRAGRLGRRLPQLLLGLWLYGVSLAMIVRAALGNAPWDVLHQGLAHHLPLTFGQVLIVVSVAVLLLWIPIREIPGLGTVLNTFLIGIAADWTLSFWTLRPRCGCGLPCLWVGFSSTALPRPVTSARSLDQDLAMAS